MSLFNLRSGKDTTEIIISHIKQVYSQEQLIKQFGLFGVAYG